MLIAFSHENDALVLAVVSDDMNDFSVLITVAARGVEERDDSLAITCALKQRYQIFFDPEIF